VVSGDGWRRAKCAAGYEVVKRTDSEGEPVRGERKINEAEGRDCPPYLQGVRGGEIAVRHRDRSEPRWHSRAIGRTMYAAIDDALLVITPQDKCCLGSNAKVAPITDSRITGPSREKSKK
jgi:hypothetical protein